MPLLTRYWSLLILIGLTSLTQSCSSSKKMLQTSSPQQADTLPALPVSQIDIPIHIYAPPLFAKAELMAPKEITSDGWPDYVQPSCDFRYKYRFLRSGLSISCTDDNIGVQFTGNYQVTGGKTICSMNTPVSPWISGSCGFGKESMRKVNVRINSHFVFLPSYQLRSSSSIAQLQAVDQCEVSIFSRNITELVVDSIRSSTAFFCSALDQTIAALNFSSLLNESKNVMEQSSLGKYGFLRIHPESIRIGQLNYANDSFRISVGLSAHPELSPDSLRVRNTAIFPKLDQKENRSGISLYLNATYDYAFISKIISDTLRNKVFDIKGRTIVVKDVQLKGSKDHEVEIRIDFAGSNEGSIYLKGTPVLDTAKQILIVPDVSYSLESKDLVLNMAESLFRNKIRKSLQGNSYLDLGALVKAKLPELNARLNKELTKNVFSSGKATSIRLIGIMAGPKQLQIQLHVTGELAILSTGLF
jgi:hypothetical protein